MSSFRLWMLSATASSTADQIAGDGAVQHELQSVPSEQYPKDARQPNVAEAEDRHADEFGRVPDEEEGAGEQRPARHGGSEGNPIPLQQRGEHQAAADADECVVDEPCRKTLHLPIDDRQENAAEDEGQNGGKLRAGAETPEGEREQHCGHGVEGVLL